MDFYQIVQFKIDNKYFYCIWFLCENEGFLSDSGIIIFFDNIKNTQSYALEHQICLDDEINNLDIDMIEEWEESSDISIDCNQVLDYWNIFQDISASKGLIFLGNKRTENIDSVYDKLFYGTNVLTKNDEEKYYPVWKKEEVVLLKKVIKDGIKIIKSSLL